MNKQSYYAIKKINSVNELHAVFEAPPYKCIKYPRKIQPGANYN